MIGKLGRLIFVTLSFSSRIKRKEDRAHLESIYRFLNYAILFPFYLVQLRSPLSFGQLAARPRSKAGMFLATMKYV
jgi:hypothetical protein